MRVESFLLRLGFLAGLRVLLGEGRLFGELVASAWLFSRPSGSAWLGLLFGLWLCSEERWFALCVWFIERELSWLLGSSLRSSREERQLRESRVFCALLRRPVRPALLSRGALCSLLGSRLGATPGPHLGGGSSGKRRIDGKDQRLVSPARA